MTNKLTAGTLPNPPTGGILWANSPLFKRK